MSNISVLGLSNVRIVVEEAGGWRHYKGRLSTIWINGHLFGSSVDDLLVFLDNMSSTVTIEAIGAWLATLDGFFGLIAKTPYGVLVAADRLRSFPLLYMHSDCVYFVGNNGPAIESSINNGKLKVNRRGALSVGMCGYAQGDETIYDGLKQLRPGECLFVTPDNKLQLHRYYIYAPWRVDERGKSDLLDELCDITLALFKKMVDSLDGRPVAIPLSAGLDSRLVVTALYNLGYKDVRCFAYGIPNNFEARTSREIAERLNYSWSFVPYTQARQRDLMNSNLYSDYSNYADWFGSFPFPQDVLAISELKGQGWLPQETVVINGNSGDFISGGHIPSVLSQNVSDSLEQKRMLIFKMLANKHFSLWENLKTPENLSLMWERVNYEWDLGGVNPTADNTSHGLYEFIEWQERQCKYVISGQRVYEFFGYDWRLPLWDLDYLRFWEGVPVQYKINQVLYREMLNRLNWGNLWNGFPVRRYLSPRWISPLRMLAKIPFVFSGREMWHEFEIRYFAYWRQLNCNFAMIPYKRVRTDRRGFRAGGHSWLAEAYLNAKDIGIDGFLFGGEQ